ncbi:MAG: hypothetical protein NTV34_12600 [Proteobacteria bacterium]|nr:hypothetical protein [Pseudomonadota bacterium]
MLESNINEQLLKQCMHRFRSLEVELNEAARSGLITELHFNQRSNGLLRLRSRLESIIEIRNQSRDLPRMDSAVIDLPILSDSSSIEQSIVLRALQENAQMLQNLSIDSQKLLAVVCDAHMDQVPWIKAIFHLSWMRTRLAWTVRQLDLVRCLRRGLEEAIRKMSLRKSQENGHGDLLDAFKEFEAMTSKLANLRAKVSTESAINLDQENWLRRYADRRRRNTESTPPPMPADLINVKDTVAMYISSGSNKARERLAIATKLADSLTKDLNARSLGSSSRPNSNQKNEKQNGKHEKNVGLSESRDNVTKRSLIANAVPELLTLEARSKALEANLKPISGQRPEQLFNYSLGVNEKRKKFGKGERL